MLINNTANPHGNCFTVPNEIYNLGLSMGAIAVYEFLLRLENRRPGKDQYTCHPSYATIGNALKRSARTVAKYVQELVEAGLILTEPTSVTTKDGQKWNGNLCYTILPIKRAVDLYHERQLAKLTSGVRKKRKAMEKVEKKCQRKQKPHDEYVAERSAHAPEELPCWDVI